MEWFNGQLEVTYINGRVRVWYDLTFAKATAQIERERKENPDRITYALFYPSPTSM